MRRIFFLSIFLFTSGAANAGFVISLGGAELSNSGAGALAPNAVTLTFENISALNGDNRVQLTIDAPNQTIQQWWWEKGKLVLFNSLHSLQSIDHLDGVEADYVYPFTKKFLGANFNVAFKFEKKGDTGSFYPGKTSRYILTGFGGDLDAETSFNVARLTNSGATTLGGIHILETFDENGNPTGSGKYGSTGGDGNTGAVPEPASIALWSLCCGVGLLLARRRSQSGTPAV